MIWSRRNNSVYHDHSEILDVAVNRVKQEDLLHFCRKTINGIEDRREVSEQHREDTIEIAGIPEEYIQGGQDHPDPDIEYNQAACRIQEQEKSPCKGDVIKGYKNKVQQQRQAKVNQALDVLGQQKQILWDPNLTDNLAVGYNCSHSTVCCLGKIGEKQIATEEVDRVMGLCSAKELCKYQFHDQQMQQGIQHAP